MSGVLAGDHRSSSPLVMETCSWPEDLRNNKQESFDPLDGPEENFNAQLDNLDKQVCIKVNLSTFPISSAKIVCLLYNSYSC